MLAFLLFLTCQSAGPVSFVQAKQYADVSAVRLPCVRQTSTRSSLERWLSQRQVSWTGVEDLPAVVDSLLLDHPQLTLALAAAELWRHALDLANENAWQDAQHLLTTALLLHFAPFIEDAWEQGPLSTSMLTLELDVLNEGLEELLLLLTEVLLNGGEEAQDLQQLETAFAVIKLARLLRLTAQAGLEDWETDVEDRLELVTNWVLDAMVVLLSSKNLQELQHLAAHAREVPLMRCNTHRNCLVSVVLARRLPLLVVGDTAGPVKVQRMANFRMLDGDLPSSKMAYLAALLQEIMRVDTGLHQPWQKLQVQSTAVLVAGVDQQRKQQLLYRREICTNRQTPAGKPVRRRLWSDVFRFSSQRLNDLWWRTVASTYVNYLVINDMLPRSFDFLSPYGVAGCTLSRLKVGQQTILYIEGYGSTANNAISQGYVEPGVLQFSPDVGIKLLPGEVYTVSGVHGQPDISIKAVQYATAPDGTPRARLESVSEPYPPRVEQQCKSPAQQQHVNAGASCQRLVKPADHTTACNRCPTGSNGLDSMKANLADLAAAAAAAEDADGLCPSGTCEATHYDSTEHVYLHRNQPNLLWLTCVWVLGVLDYLLDSMTLGTFSAWLRPDGQQHDQYPPADMTSLYLDGPTQYSLGSPESTGHPQAGWLMAVRMIFLGSLLTLLHLVWSLLRGLWEGRARSLQRGRAKQTDAQRRHHAAVNLREALTSGDAAQLAEALSTAEDVGGVAPQLLKHARQQLKLKLRRQEQQLLQCTRRQEARAEQVPVRSKKAPVRRVVKPVPINGQQGALDVAVRGLSASESLAAPQEAAATTIQLLALPDPADLLKQQLAETKDDQETAAAVAILPLAVGQDSLAMLPIRTDVLARSGSNATSPPATPPTTERSLLPVISPSASVAAQMLQPSASSSGTDSGTDRTGSPMHAEEDDEGVEQRLHSLPETSTAAGCAACSTTAASSHSSIATATSTGSKMVCGLHGQRLEHSADQVTSGVIQTQMCNAEHASMSMQDLGEASEASLCLACTVCTPSEGTLADASSTTITMAGGSTIDCSSTSSLSSSLHIATTDQLGSQGSVNPVGTTPYAVSSSQSTGAPAPSSNAASVGAAPVHAQKARTAGKQLASAALRAAVTQPAYPRPKQELLRKVSAAPMAQSHASTATRGGVGAPSHDTQQHAAALGLLQHESSLKQAAAQNIDAAVVAAPEVAGRQRLQRSADGGARTSFHKPSARARKHDRSTAGGKQGNLHARHSYSVPDSPNHNAGRQLKVWEDSTAHSRTRSLTQLQPHVQHTISQPSTYPARGESGSSMRANTVAASAPVSPVSMRKARRGTAHATPQSTPRAASIASTPLASPRGPCVLNTGQLLSDSTLQRLMGLVGHWSPPGSPSCTPLMNTLTEEAMHHLVQSQQLPASPEAPRAAEWSLQWSAASPTSNTLADHTAGQQALLQSCLLSDISSSLDMHIALQQRQEAAGAASLLLNSPRARETLAFPSTSFPSNANSVTQAAQQQQQQAAATALSLAAAAFGSSESVASFSNVHQASLPGVQAWGGLLDGSSGLSSLWGPHGDGTWAPPGQRATVSTPMGGWDHLETMVTHSSTLDGPDHDTGSPDALQESLFGRAVAAAATETMVDCTV